MKKIIISIIMSLAILLPALPAFAENSDMQLINLRTLTSGEVTGSVEDKDGKITLATNGIDAWGQEDAFSAYITKSPVIVKDKSSQQIIVQATVGAISNVSVANASTGILMRSGKEKDEPNVMLRMTSGGGIRFTYRSTSGDRSYYELGPNLTFPADLRIVYEKETATGYYLKNGVWMKIATIDINLGNEIYGGVGAFSADIGNQVVCTYSNLKFGVADDSFNQILSGEQSTAGDSFGEWEKSTYIGTGSATDLKDSADFSNGVYTINTNGINAWGMNDSMTTILKKDGISFLYGEKSKVIFSATVNSIAPQSSNSTMDTNASAGIVMRREDSDDSANVMLRVVPDGGIRFTYRTLKGAKTEYMAAPSIGIPVNLKLERLGDTVTAFYGNEKGWNEIGSVDIDLGTVFKAGFGAFSLNKDVGITAKFSNALLESYNGYIPEEEEFLAVQTGEDYLLIEDFADKNLKNKSVGVENPTWIQCEQSPIFEEDEAGKIWWNKDGVKGISYVGNTKWTDYEASIDFIMSGASANNVFELLVRARPKSVSKLRGEYYYSFSMGTTSYNVFQCESSLVNDRRTGVNSGKFTKSYADGSSHNLKIRVLDNKLSVYIDDTLLCDYTDTRAFKSLWGCVGIKTNGEGVKFSNLVVKKINDETGGDYDNFLGTGFDKPIQSWYNKIVLPE